MAAGPMLVAAELPNDNPVKAVAQAYIQAYESKFGVGSTSTFGANTFDAEMCIRDRSFTRDMNDDPDDKTIIHTIVQMSQNLSLRTIAEGVENEQMLTCLKDLNCDEAQGYYIARPMPIEQFKEYLLESQRKTAQTIAR